MADQAHDDWELSFESIGDPHQEISRTCSEKGLLTLYANVGSLSFLQSGVNWKIDHPKGFFQPGVLVLTKQYRVLYRWRSVPSGENLNGTTMRPTAAHVWEKTRRSLETGDSAVDASLDDNPVVDQNPPPLFLFFAAIVANGWFVKPKPFVYEPGMEPISSRFQKAISRWILFFSVWIIALSILPTTWVGGAFGAWLVWAIFNLRSTMKQMGRQVELKAH